MLLKEDTAVAAISSCGLESRTILTGSTTGCNLITVKGEKVFLMTSRVGLVQ